LPIYEYIALNPEDACHNCLRGFEIYQKLNEKPLTNCLYCDGKVKKIISFCHSAIVEQSLEYANAENKIKEYEKSDKWSHAAELADNYSERFKDDGLKIRALENYHKAGYSIDLLNNQTELNSE
jgi:predicted nucleic acid-binding Zn ribbon protein